MAGRLPASAGMHWEQHSTVPVLRAAAGHPSAALVAAAVLHPHAGHHDGPHHLWHLSWPHRPPRGIQQRCALENVLLALQFWGSSCAWLSSNWGSLPFLEEFNSGAHLVILLALTLGACHVLA
jgi:hypothetical protein